MWGAILLLAFVSGAKADLTTVAGELKEDQKKAISSRLDEPESRGPREEIEKPAQALGSISNELEKSSSTFLGRNETSSAPGAILRSFDAKYLEQKVSFPVTEAPWWERWWFSIKEWWASEVTQ